MHSGSQVAGKPKALVLIGLQPLTRNMWAFIVKNANVQMSRQGRGQLVCPLITSALSVAGP